ncbi:MAG: hypothetical protein QMD11_07430 [Smithella sp.]|nr:hypothetical protein [Smithella sp.]
MEKRVSPFSIVLLIDFIGATSGAVSVWLLKSLIKGSYKEKEIKIKTKKANNKDWGLFKTTPLW